MSFILNYLFICIFFVVMIAKLSKIVHNIYFVYVCVCARARAHVRLCMTSDSAPYHNIRHQAADAAEAFLNSVRKPLAARSARNEIETFSLIMAPTLYDVKPEPGDLIEIFRGSYQHWAVYIGDGFIVHLAPPSEVPGAGANSVMSVFCENALVKRAELWDVVGTDKWQINNTLDDQYEPRPADLVVQEALDSVGDKLPYCVFQMNCEHFATELRYGKAQSRQVRRAGEVVIAAGVATVVGLGLVALAGAIFGGGRREKKDTQ
ncbi:unnamed protein product [Boreogadus saida]